FAFLGSVMCMGSILLVGGSACLFDVGERGIDQLLRWLLDPPINHLSAVPSVVSSLLAVMERQDAVAPAVRILCTGGEAVAANDLAAMRRRFPSARILNAYGCQEAGSVTFYEVPADFSAADGPPPAGWVLPAYSVDVVDEAGQPLETGESGEI